MKSQRGVSSLFCLIFIGMIIFVILCFIPPIKVPDIITTTQINNGTTTTLIYPKPPITTTEYIVNDGVTTTEYIHH